MNVAAMPLSRKKIRNLAFELRKIMGWDDEPYFPIVHFIEWILANPEGTYRIAWLFLQKTYLLLNLQEPLILPQKY